MQIKDDTIKKRQITCHLNDDDLFSILSEYVAKKSGFKIDPRKTKVDVFISKKDIGTGFRNEARVTLTNDLE